MVIIFYDKDREELCICTEKEKMIRIPVKERDIASHIPNDDIFYVQQCHILTKAQFIQSLSGGMNLNPPVDEQPQQVQHVAKIDAKYIHPMHNGTIFLADIRTDKYPNGIELTSKWHFINIEEVGGFDVLESSALFRSLLAKGSIEIVDFEYVKKHYKKHNNKSLKDIALDAIIVKDASPGAAVDVASSGGIQGTQGMLSPSDAIEIEISRG